MSNRMWGGRFASGPAEIMEEINASIGFDKRLAPQDIRGSLAHVAMLGQAGILPAEDVAAIEAGLKSVRDEIEAGTFAFKRELEDIHMSVESRLTEIVGPAAGRLHTARSRNDQVATDMKLWVRDTLDSLDQQAADLQRALSQTALKHAGTSFPIDRHATAAALGFDRPTANSLDSVADRDFALEALAAASICAVHLSRFAEELVVWTSAQFNFVRLSDGFTTGSSIMPQKRNPDAAELVRAKSGRIIGALTGLLIVMKGLPLAYSKDMQEDKEGTFDALQALSLCLAALTGMVQDLEPNAEVLAQAAGSGYATATDLADWLVRELGLPFRQAHHVTGRLVGVASAKGVGLEELSLAEMQEAEPRITDAVYAVLGVANSVASRTSYGGTAPENVRAQAQGWIERLA